jgi:hypothetical protein
MHENTAPEMNTMHYENIEILKKETHGKSDSENRKEKTRNHKMHNLEKIRKKPFGEDR